MHCISIALLLEVGSTSTQQLLPSFYRACMPTLAALQLHELAALSDQDARLVHHQLLCPLHGAKYSLLQEEYLSDRGHTKPAKSGNSSAALACCAACCVLLAIVRVRVITEATDLLCTLVRSRNKRQDSQN